MSIGYTIHRPRDSPVQCRILPFPEEYDVDDTGQRAVHAIANGLVLFAVVYGLIGALLVLFRVIANKVRDLEPVRD